MRCRPRTTALHRLLGIAPGAAPPWLCAPDACQGFDLLQAAELVIIAGVVALGVVRSSWWPLLVVIPAMAWFGLRVHAPLESHERLWRARRRQGECPWCGRRGDGPGGSCQGCGDRAEQGDAADPGAGPLIYGVRLMWRDLRNDAIILTEPRCPCYCGGVGMLVLVACPACGTVMGRCDEVEQLIRDVRHPAFDPDRSICHPDVPCPVCQAVPYGQFRAATESALRATGLSGTCYRRWRA